MNYIDAVSWFVCVVVTVYLVCLIADNVLTVASRAWHTVAQWHTKRKMDRDWKKLEKTLK